MPLISVEKQKQIRLLLNKGLSKEEVAKRVGVHKKTVLRLCNLHSTYCKESEKKCSYSKKTISIREVNFELFCIVRDIQELHKLGLISHPLFKELACRARKSLRRFHDVYKVSQ